MEKRAFLLFRVVVNFKKFPPTLSLNDRISLKRKAKRLQLTEGQLFCEGRRILLSDETEKHLQESHERQGHLIENDHF